MPWLRRLADARSETEVLRICQEYFAALSRSEIELLPKECRPVRMESPEEIRAYALTLVRHHAHGDSARLILRIADFYSKAAEQLNRIATQPR